MRIRTAFQTLQVNVNTKLCEGVLHGANQLWNAKCSSLNPFACRPAAQITSDGAIGRGARFAFAHLQSR
jgi:hypothetical protein